MEKKTLKEKVAYFAEMQRKSKDMPDCFIGWGSNEIRNAFLADCQETCDFIKTADTDELECFVSVIIDFIKKYPESDIIQACIERKSQVGDFETLDFDDEILLAKKTLL